MYLTGAAGANEASAEEMIRKAISATQTRVVVHSARIVFSADAMNARYQPM